MEPLSKENLLTVVVPNPLIKVNDINVFSGCAEVISHNVDHIIPINNCSNFYKLVRIYKNILIFVNNLKLRLKAKDPVKFSGIPVLDSDHNFYELAVRNLVKVEQMKEFPEIFEYFSRDIKKLKDIPNLVKQLNIYADKFGILRVRSKSDKLKNQKLYNRFNFPILLPKCSELTKLIVSDAHSKLSHAGLYSVLSELRKQFWIPSIFSVVKKTIKGCVICKRFNNRTISLNQSPYREMRLSPENVPFKNLYLDYLGPFMVKQNNKNVKVWVLIFTCMWSRAVNLKLCVDQSTDEFLRSFQLHCFDFGIPENCTSDLGSQIVAGANILKTYFSDADTQNYLNEKGIKHFKFDHYYKGCSKLGGLVEICVKMVKKLLFSSIGKNILNFRDFEFILAKTLHLVNRRPVAFKSVVRQNINDTLPDPITPELLLKGYNLPSLNIIPGLTEVRDPDWIPSESVSHILDSNEKLKSVRSKLVELYNEEFISNLVNQAVAKKDLYKPVIHKTIKPGDIVLVRDEFTKPNNYPMARVKSIIQNDLGEVTAAIVQKGSTKELLKRHSSALIPFLTINEDFEESKSHPVVGANESNSRPQRKAATEGQIKTKNLIQNNLI